MYYRTRHLVARRPLRYDKVELQPGDFFHATDIDAKYLISRGRAEALPEEQPVPAAPENEAPVVALDVSALLAESSSDTPVEAGVTDEGPTEDAPQAESAQEDALPPLPFRGRRRRAAQPKPEADE